MKLLSICALVLAFLAVVQTFAADSFEVPAAQILEASRKIFPQTGPFFEVSGELNCMVAMREFPPSGADKECEVAIGEKTESFVPNKKLLDALMAHKPMKGPFYSVHFSFKGTSISQEAPPYGVTEKVELSSK